MTNQKLLVLIYQYLKRVIQDEPSLNQSDKAKIDLMMQNTIKQYRGGKYTKVHAI